MHGRIKNNKKLVILTSLFIIVIGGFALFQSPTLAQENDNDIDCSECGIVPCQNPKDSPNTTCNNNCPYCEAKPELTVFENLITANTTKELVDKIADFVAYIGIPLSVLFIVYSGIRLLLSQGNPEKTQAAKRTLTWSIIGAGIILATYVIINTIYKFFETKGFQ